MLERSMSDVDMGIDVSGCGNYCGGVRIHWNCRHLGVDCAGIIPGFPGLFPGSALYRTKAAGDIGKERMR